MNKGNNNNINPGSDKYAESEHYVNVDSEALPGPVDKGFIAQGGELSLSNPGQLELLLAMIDKGASLRTTVRGFSMTPLIRDGDVLTISPCTGGSLGLGDVAAFSHPETGRLVIHRIVGRSAKGLIIKGDNCYKADGVIGRGEVIGLIGKAERKGQPLKLGFGPEKCLIALLSRCGLLLTIKSMLFLLYRFAGRFLNALQRLRIYRKAGRRLLGDVVVTVAGENDLEEAYRLINPGKLYKKRPVNHDLTNLVAIRKNRVIGFAQLVYRPPERRPWDGFWLCSMYVKGNYRGLGLGCKLALVAVNEAVKKNAPRIRLIVNQKNIKAIRLYDKLGFLQVENHGLSAYIEKERARSGNEKLIFEKTLEDADGQNIFRH